MESLNLREVRALALLRARGPLSLKEISREMGIPPSSAHGMLTKLQALGLVSKDPETKRYEITEKGLSMLRELQSILARG